jgi:tetratricopeptide (TPR) repeat protein
MAATQAKKPPQPVKVTTPKQAMERVLQFYKSGNLARAEAICRKIVNIQPGFHPAWYQLGLIAVRVGKLKQAVEFFLKAAKLAPDTAQYHKALGEACRRLKRFKGAVAAGKRAAGLAPKNPGILYNYALALADSGELRAAAEQYRAALALKPAYGLAANNLGTVLERLGDAKGAEAAYARAVAINPRHAEAQNNLGALMSESSRLEGARTCFAAAIEANPAFVASHYNLSTLKKYTPDDPQVAMLEKLAPRAEKLSNDEQIRFWFSLAKVREDVGHYDEAFAAYERANRLKRATMKYNEKTSLDAMRDVTSRFDAALFAKNKGAGFKDETPVFIIGMPRSGTTLIEQIISSHSAVHGAGELRDLGEALGDVQPALAKGASYMNWLSGADKKALTAAGEAYIRRLRSYDAKALRITDKMPGNFFYAGLILKVLPQAKIIHSVRHPLDICFSNYARLFKDTMPFAYDLTELGHYYKSYRQMMDHWKKVLPAGSILDVNYEDVVEDLEGQSRRLIDFCGLPWESACLDFHNNKRPVKTASVAQVSQPIYKSSVARWERFAKHLGPLQKAIG